MYPKRNRKYFLENRGGNLHLAMKGKLPTFALFLWTAFGGGITYLMQWNPKYSKFQSSGNASYYLDKEAQQKNLRLILRTCLLLRSLEVRDGYSHFLPELERLSRLNHIWIQGELVGAYNLKRLQRLETLGSTSPSIQNVRGLENLKHLKFVYVKNVKLSWFLKLPQSVERIYTSGQLPTGVPLGKLPHLDTLGINGCRKFDLAILMPSVSLIELHLTNISVLEGTPNLLGKYPNLQRVRTAGLREADYRLLQKTNSGIEFSHEFDFRS